MSKIAVIGYFKSGAVADGGQGIKTAILTEELEKVLGNNEVIRIDTDGWRKHPLVLFRKCLKSVFACDNVLFLTDENGIKVFPRLLEILNFFSIKHARLHYYVVGGWLNKYLMEKPSERRALKKLDAIYVEIPSMKQFLDDNGFDNVVLVNKFRRLQDLSHSIDNNYSQLPMRLCFFARVMKEKGIEEAISAVKKINEKLDNPRVSLDIFGAVDPSYVCRFEELKDSFPCFIQYRGVIDFRESTEVLSQYFAMLFPTYYKSEGYPNTVVDAYAAGLPIIATNWNYNAEIIKNYEDGILVEVGNINQIVEAVNYLGDNMSRYVTMRKNCLNRRSEYMPENAIKKVIDELK